MTSEKLQRPPSGGARDGHPILAGLVALVAVVVVIGAVVGGAALVASRSLGLSDDGSISAGSTEKQTLFLPEPSETEGSDGPYITLPSQPETSEPPKDDFTKPPKPKPITLTTEQTAVGPMERLYLTGTYAEGEGSVLRVEQFEAGAWSEFPVTASVSGGQFSTYIQAGALGLNRFRVVDSDSGEASNEIRVQIG